MTKRQFSFVTGLFTFISGCSVTQCVIDLFVRAPAIEAQFHILVAIMASGFVAVFYMIGE